MKSAGKLILGVTAIAVIAGVGTVLYRPSDPDPEWITYLRDLHRGEHQVGLLAQWMGDRGVQLATDEDATGTQETLQLSDLSQKEADRVVQLASEVLRRPDATILKKKASKGDPTLITMLEVRVGKRYSFGYVIPDPARREATRKAGGNVSWHGIGFFTKFTPFTLGDRVRRYFRS